jgi:hypothetical protein
MNQRKPYDEFYDSYPRAYRSPPRRHCGPSHRLQASQNGSQWTLGRYRVLLDLVIPFGGRHFITNGTLTRYDIAIDLWGGSVDQVLVLSKRSQKNGVYTDRNGCPETV